MAKQSLLCLVRRHLKPSLLRLGRVSNFLKCLIVIFSEKQSGSAVVSCSNSTSDGKRVFSVLQQAELKVTIFFYRLPQGNKINLALFRISFVSFFSLVL